VAPFAAVFFLLVIFLVFHSGLVLTPGLPVNLPKAEGLPGLTNQAVVVAVVANGTCFYENQVTSQNELKTKLRSIAKIRQPLTLVLQADREVRHETLIELFMIARDAGIDQTLLAVRSQAGPTPLPSKP
jgi:biopolymer transport protein ExbD